MRVDVERSRRHPDRRVAVTVGRVGDDADAKLSHCGGELGREVEGADEMLREAVAVRVRVCWTICADDVDRAVSRCRRGPIALP